MARTASTLITAALTCAILACGGAHDAVTAPAASTPTPTPAAGGPTFANNPCTSATNVAPAVNTTVLIDCSNGGTTMTFAGLGASYVIVPQFATDNAAFSLVSYRMNTGTVVSANFVPTVGGPSASLRRLATPSLVGGTPAAGILPPIRPSKAQMAADRFLRARGRTLAQAGSIMRGVNFSLAPGSVSRQTAPATGSVRAFHVLSSFSATSTWKTVGARLAYIGNSVLLYIDTTRTTGALTTAQEQQFGAYVDGTLYALDTAAFGGPSDVDGNGHVIMLMSPVVNADSPKATCATNGYVAGFFNEQDFDGASDPNSNQGEIFYAIAPDSAGAFSCRHTAADVMFGVPGTFMHELQHLIYYSQHVVLGGGAPGASWMDEGLSIAAEELGSLYYEKRCPPPQCRTNPAQLFPDSAQGFVSDFIYDSYEYALVPDTASITLSDDSMDGFSWRGGAWMFMRYLADQYGTGIWKQFERGSPSGATAIANATGQPFGTVYSTFGMALETDSLPGLARNTAPAVDRFTTRNMKQLWARLFATSGGTSDIPMANPLQLFPITTDTSTAIMYPGTNTYFRLDTQASQATVTVRFGPTSAASFLPALKPQVMVYRLPAGQ